MIGAALAATGLWSLSTLASARGARHLGGISANLVRVGLALPLLVLSAFAVGLSPWSAGHAVGADWFLLSGVLGMGICDILILSAYARRGARVTTLVVNAVAAPTAAIIGWVFLDERLGMMSCVSIGMILVGVVLVLRPRPGDRFDAIGVTWAVLGALAFACSSVFSRIGYAEALASGRPIHWLDATILRVAAGLALCAVAFVAAAPIARAWRDGPGRWRAALPWLALNATIGPGAGLVCYQWALTTTPAAEVHAIVAVIPVVVMASTWFTGDERPEPAAVLGTLTAVAGVIALTALH